MKKIFQCLFVMFLLLMNVKATNYYVSSIGSNQNPGTKELPFRTIQKAADVALSGDVITVREGVYREWVSPVNSGYHKSLPITYQAASGEEVYIKGSEIVTGWKKYKKNVWETSVENTIFGDFNPFEIKVGGDWFLAEGTFHLGEVYMDEKSLYETDALSNLEHPVAHENTQNKEAALLQWFADVKDKETIIYANFGEGVNPNKHLIEINVRPTCFFPKKTGVNYITVRGFHISQAATQWAPPTGEQIGIIGPHWSKGWVIENNVISNSKCVGISLGKERASGLNEALYRKNLKGFHREIEAVFKAIDLGWNKNNIGSHIVRNNTIFNCEQAGICGHMGAAFSTIEYNEIYDINVKKQLIGSEIAGIKLHCPIDVLIAHNYVINAHLGIWLDWEAEGTRVTGNLFADNLWQDIFIEVSHGPTLIDNNIALSHCSITFGSHGVAAVHNLFGGTIRALPILHRYTPYHYPHSTKLKGFAAIGGGDHRLYNNIFASGEELSGRDCSGSNALDPWPVYYDGIYNTYTGKTSGGKTTWFSYPVYVERNVYFNSAEQYNGEVCGVLTNQKAEFKLEKKDDGLYLLIDLPIQILENISTDWITTDKLGITAIGEGSYENPDGTPLKVNNDFFGKIRQREKPLVGPFREINSKEIKLFDLKGF